MFGRLVLVLLLPFCLAKSPEVTFKNVTFRGYTTVFEEKFKKTIPLSNALKDFLPESEFNVIAFFEQNIPVLYENSLADLGNVDEIMLNKCDLYEIRPGALKNVPSLRHVYLQDNKIEEIKEGVFNNLALTAIDLSRNLITTIHTNAFDNMPKLMSMHLSYNRLTRWNEDWFKNTPLLTRVCLMKNSISTIPNHAFKNFVGSKKVGIILSRNKIKTINPEAFRGLTEISFLMLDGNQLEEFNEDLLDGIKVFQLSLSFNNIRCLEGDLAKIIKATYTTNLDFIPFDCECFSKIKEWAKKNDKDVTLVYSDEVCQRTKTEKVPLEDIGVAENETFIESN